MKVAVLILSFCGIVFGLNYDRSRRHGSAILRVIASVNYTTEAKRFTNGWSEPYNVRLTDDPQLAGPTVAAEQPSRRKREAVGALDIVTNNAQPIHAEVKPENVEVEKCPHTQGNHVPSKIEPGVVFQVTPPKPALYEAKSLRKSLPLTTKLDLVRGINRLITLLVLAVSAVFEFYPVIKQACESISDILYNTT